MICWDFLHTFMDNTLKQSHFFNFSLPCQWWFRISSVQTIIFNNPSLNNYVLSCNVLVDFDNFQSPTCIMCALFKHQSRSYFIWSAISILFLCIFRSASEPATPGNSFLGSWQLIASQPTSQVFYLGRYLSIGVF